MRRTGPLHADETGFDRAAMVSDDRAARLRKLEYDRGRLLHTLTDATADVEDMIDHIFEALDELDERRCTRTRILDWLAGNLKEMERLDHVRLYAALGALDAG